MTASRPRQGPVQIWITKGEPLRPKAGPPTTASICHEEGVMACAKLQEYLDQHHVRYVSIKHSPAFTAQEIAGAAHIPGKDVAKTVIVKLDGTMAMVVLPAPEMVRMKHLKAETGSDKVELASEEEFKGRFPDCEVGAMPPFGNLYEMDVFVEESLTEGGEIAFNAGTHTELIRMAYADYEKLVGPKVLRG